MLTLTETKTSTSLNDGIVVLGRKYRPLIDKDPKTLIVSGLARSGTSMVAAMLAAAGVYMGDDKDDIVHEDHEIAHYLEKQTLIKLRGAVAIRNAKYKIWGFKKPNIHDFLNPKQRPFFRNPYYIFTFRDPIAVAKRNIVSELFDESMAMAQAAKMQGLMVRFILRLRHPVLLISYEKALQFPSQCVDSVAQFAGLQVDEEQRERMLAAVEPNRQEYLATAKRVFQGSVDGVNNGVLRGWCRQVGLLEPIEISLFINEARVATVLADNYREDLAAAGIGSGEHAFNVDLRAFRTDPSHVVDVFAHGRSFKVENSGKTIRELLET